MKDSKEKEHRISNLKDMINNVKDESDNSDIEEDAELIKELLGGASTETEETEKKTIVDEYEEQLAEELGVSRQSISKWEMGQAQPQIDNILQLCSLFSVSASDLLHDEIEIKKASDKKQTIVTASRSKITL